MQASHREEWRFLRTRKAPFIDNFVPDPAGYDETTCSCSCCEVTRRLPDEIKDPTNFLKCALPLGFAGSTLTRVKDELGNIYTEPKSCGRSGMRLSRLSACKPLSPLLSSTASETDYNRFCFYNCQPHNYETGTICIEYSPQEQLAAFDIDGNGKDINLPPAIVVDATEDAYVGITKFQPYAAGVVDVPPADIDRQLDSISAQTKSSVAAQRALDADEASGAGTFGEFGTGVQIKNPTVTTDLLTGSLGVGGGQQSSKPTDAGTLGGALGRLGNLESLSDSAASEILTRASSISRAATTAAQSRTQEPGLYEDAKYRDSESDQPNVGMNTYDGNGVVDHDVVSIPGRLRGNDLPKAATPMPCFESKSCAGKMITESSIYGNEWLTKTRDLSRNAAGNAEAALG